MDDLISRAAAIDAHKRAAYWQDGERKIAELPAVDAVPVVRCRYCKYWKDQSGTSKWLPCREIQTSGMWFCADGERREYGENSDTKRE